MLIFTFIISETLPNVSIIIPLYNQAHFLTDAVRSIELQTLQNYEILVIDDQSTDNAQQVIKHLQELDNRIINIQLKENQGPFLARAKGIINAKGKYIVFIDADDFLNSITILQHAFELAEEKSADIVHFNEKLLEADRESAFNWANPANDSVQGKYFGLTQWMLNGQGTALHGKLFLKNQLLRAIVLIQNQKSDIFQTKLYYSEDTLMMLAFYTLQEKYVPLLEFGYTYTIRPNSLSKSSVAYYDKFVKRVDDSLIVYHIVKKILSVLPEAFQRNIHFQFFKYMKSSMMEIELYHNNDADKKAFMCEKLLNSGVLIDEYVNKLKSEHCDVIIQ
ncbi:Glycosyl_transferase family 2 protein [Hexamita inflata]|uniref:Glycosyl transferase family 2 protein n=1 Tax=Hexamita inflata TaxID=28002 RepID=A0AA86TE54_9EUKA|nr:Glycosyl transferase family 2 protein [Hexamita inflata]